MFRGDLPILHHHYIGAPEYVCLMTFPWKNDFNNAVRVLAENFIDWETIHISRYFGEHCMPNTVVINPKDMGKFFRSPFLKGNVHVTVMKYA